LSILGYNLVEAFFNAARPIEVIFQASVASFPEFFNKLAICASSNPKFNKASYFLVSVVELSNIEAIFLSYKTLASSSITLLKSFFSPNNLLVQPATCYCYPHCKATSPIKFNTVSVVNPILALAWSEELPVAYIILASNPFKIEFCGSWLDHKELTIPQTIGAVFNNSLATNAPEYMAATSGPISIGATPIKFLARDPEILFSKSSESKKSYLLITEDSDVKLSKVDNTYLE
jgi:hypothetical protein